MQITDLLKIYDKQWYLDFNMAKIFVYRISKNTSITFSGENNSIMLTHNETKKHSHNLYYFPDTNMIEYRVTKTGIYHDVIEKDLKFPLCSTEEEFFMNSTVYDYKDFTIPDMIKIKKMHKKLFDLVYYGKEK